MPKMEFAAVATDTVGTVRIVGVRPVAAKGPVVVAGKTWMRNRETGEAVLVTETGVFMTRYQNADCEGEVQTAKLLEHFQVLEGMPADAEPA